MYVHAQAKNIKEIDTFKYENIRIKLCSSLSLIVYHSPFTLLQTYLLIHHFWFSVSILSYIHLFVPWRFTLTPYHHHLSRWVAIYLLCSKTPVLVSLSYFVLTPGIKLPPLMLYTHLEEGSCTVGYLMTSLVLVPWKRHPLHFVKLLALGKASSNRNHAKAWCSLLAC